MSRPVSSNRPISAQSRTAWGDGGGGPSSSGLENRGIVDDEGDHTADPSWTAQRSMVAVAGPAIDDGVHVHEPPSGCFYMFKKGIRSIWATRETEEIHNNKELTIRTTLRELLIYILFLAILCIVTFGMTSPTMYYYTKVMSELFLDSQFVETKNTFRGMTTMQDFWRSPIIPSRNFDEFAEGPLVDGLYWETWYNDRNVSNDELGYIFYENKLLGVPRIRQLKVKNDSCTVHEDFKNEIKTCFDAYSEKIEETNHFGTSNGTAWYYFTQKELDGSNHWGLISSYGGGGYVENLGKTKSESLMIIDELKKGLWIDRGTRAIFIDFTVYNANINLFCVIRLVFELPATGGVIPSWNFRTVKLIRYVTAGDFFVMACECIFALFIFYYMVEEFLEIKKHRLSYFNSFWNILDIIVIMLALCCICFNIYRSMAVMSKLEVLLGKPDKFPDFEFLSYWQVVFNSAVAIMVFFAWVKVFKYISFNKTMTQLSSTLARCAKDLGGFAVMFFIIFLAFAQLGYLIFGTQVRDFKSFDAAMFTLFRIILGDFNFHELEAANRILGPAYFILYVFFVFFVLLNMFLAIINDTYSEVKAELSNQKNEFDVGDYFKKGYNKMLDKLNLKRDKIVDIQKALQTADINQDKQLDFDEWRQDLKTRGYAEAEIEAVFAKYDLDGDRVLDEVEQRNMQADLEGQKEALSREFEQLEDRNKTKRPSTGKSQTDASDDDAAAAADDLDSDMDDLDDLESKRGGRKVRGAGVGMSGVTYDEFTVLSRRVDRMEHSIGSIVSKIDAVLVKLEAMEKAKSKRRDTMSRLLDSISEADGTTEAVKRERMEKLVRDELARWDSESSLATTQANVPRHHPTSRPSSASTPNHFI